MLEKLRQRSSSESGFTLVELLVVMLILGILAAIAIPTFFNQRDKARDSSAKEDVRTAQTAMETYAIDHQGKYTRRRRRPLLDDDRADADRRAEPDRDARGAADAYTLTVEVRHRDDVHDRRS